MERVIQRIAMMIFVFLLVGLTTHASFFLDNGLGLKGMQMGGAYTAVATGVDAIYWNPSRMGFSESSIYASFGQKFTDVTEYSFLYHQQIVSGSSFGVGYYRLGVDNNIRRDSNGNNLGSFQVSNEALYLAYSTLFPVVSFI